MDDLKAKILIVDDEKTYIDLLAGILSDTYNVVVAKSGEQAFKRLQSASLPDLILLDILMPKMNGYEFCQRLKKNKDTADIPVIFISALEDMDQKVAGFNAGAVDFLTKPFQVEEVLVRVHTHLTLRRQQLQLQQQNFELQEKNLSLKQLNDELVRETRQRQEAEKQSAKADRRLRAITLEEAKKWHVESFIGQSEKMIRLIDEIRALHSNARTNVLVLGESGTGKELVARAIHYGSKRSTHPFIPVNCSAISPELADAAFFGSIKGAYTGSTQNQKGYFEAANGGTLFLDEIGDMPFELQAKLLRTLEQGTITPVGSVKEKKVDVRIVAATHADLHREIGEKKFRQDLYYRLAGFQLILPPLRQRKEDIPLMARQFLAQYANEMGYIPAKLTGPVLAMLEQYHFPGNVRELRNIIENALIRSRGKDIRPEHLVGLDQAVSSDMVPTETYQGDAPSGTPSSGGRQAIQTEKQKPVETGTDPEKGPGGRDSRTAVQEKMLLSYLSANTSINNKECQALLQESHHRASYLLKKLYKDGLLIKNGERRWSYYMLADKNKTA